jgi:hypothetical protein
MSEIEADLVKLNDKLVSITNSQTPLGLLYGRMGYCIYFYKIAEISGDAAYLKLADSLLDSICSSLGNYHNLNIESGLTGIGLGINYLVKENLIEGNINIILKDFDIILFRFLSFQKKSNPEDLWLKVQLLYYFGIRLEYQKKGSKNEFIIKNLIFKILNSFSQIPDDFFEEPYSFSLDFRLPFFLYALGAVSKHDMFSEKVKKIADELTLKIISLIPILHSHKVYLIFGMSLLAKGFNISLWHKHIGLLRREIDIDYIFTNELKDKNIFFKDGISGMVFLLAEYNKSVENDEKIEYNSEYIRNRIKTSKAWDDLIDNEQFFRANSGLNGFCGLSLLNTLLV